MDRFEIDASLTHDLQGVDQFTSNLKADVSNDWCMYMQKQIKEGIFHEGSRNYKCPSKADVISWTESAWDNISPSHLVNVAVKCYMHPDDLDDDVADYGPLHGGVDINNDFEILPQHNISAVEALPPYDPFANW